MTFYHLLFSVSWNTTDFSYSGETTESSQQTYTGWRRLTH